MHKQFLNPIGNSEFLLMPSGLSNTPPGFQAVVNNVHNPIRSKMLANYKKMLQKKLNAGEKKKMLVKSHMFAGSGRKKLK